MGKFFRDLAIIVIFLGLIGLDRSYVLDDSVEVQGQIKEIAKEKVLPQKEFESDGCTLWPQALFGFSWEESCVEHDIRYWVGGSEEERLKADQDLRDEVNEVLPGMGDIVYIGVRAGGLSLVPWPWGWGFGWDGAPEATTTDEE